VVFSELPIL